MKNQRKGIKGKRQEQTLLFAAARKSNSFCAADTSMPTIKAMPIPPEYSSNQKIKDEIELFGFPLSKHPLELYHDSLKDYEFVSASEMHLHAGKQVRMIGWLITEKFAETNDGQPMGFTAFEDLTGLYDATFFPSTFRKYGHLLTGGKPYIVEGLVEEDLGECTLTVKRLEIVRHLVPMASW